MPKGTERWYDAKKKKSGKREIEVEEIEIKPPKIVAIKLDDLAKLIKYAKSKGWI